MKLLVKKDLKELSNEESDQLKNLNSLDVSYSGGVRGNEVTNKLVDQLQVSLLYKFGFSIKYILVEYLDYSLKC